MKLACHLLLFQLGWFASVLGAAWHRGFVGPLTVAILVFVQRGLLPVRGEAWRLVTAGCLGILVDSFLAATGLVTYAQNPAPAWLAPPWIVAMWVNFALAVPRSLGFLKPRPALAACMGAIFGPLAYIAGEELGAVQLLDGSTVLALAVLWGFSVLLISR